MEQMTFENKFKVQGSEIAAKGNEQPTANSEQSIAPMCAECIEFAAGKCPGKSRAEVLPGVRPCPKYNLDYEAVGITAAEVPLDVISKKSEGDAKDGLEFLDGEK